MSVRSDGISQPARRSHSKNMSTSKQTDQNHGQPGLEIALSDGLIVKSPEYPDLQVAPSDAPILQELDHSDLEVAQMVWEIGSSSDEAYAVERRSKGHKSSSTLRRIWDSRPLSFWLVLALIVVIIVAAIGGVEGRSLANQKNLAGNGGVVRYVTVFIEGLILQSLMTGEAHVQFPRLGRSPALSQSQLART